jgi:hypothetical protein
MNIVSVEEVKERMALADSEDVDTTIERCITSATSMVSSFLGTGFDLVSSQTDVFYLNSNDRPCDPMGFLRLRLTHAFLTDDIVVVKYGETVDTITAVVPAVEYMLNRRKGILYLPVAYDFQYISIVYTAGFRTAGQNTSANLPPEGLKQALYSVIPLVMNSQQITNRSEEWQSVLKEGYAQASSHLQPYLRGYGLQHKPLDLDV